MWIERLADEQLNRKQSGLPEHVMRRLLGAAALGTLAIRPCCFCHSPMAFMT